MLAQRRVAMAKNKSYTPAPKVAPQLEERLDLILEVLADRTTVSEAARRLGISRNHFQTLLHRGLTGLAEGVSPKPGGRPAKPKELLELEAELERLRRENAQLKERVGTTDRLLEVASGLLHGRIRPTARSARAKKAKGAPGENQPDEPDAERRRILDGAEQMRRLGLKAELAARVAGVHEATLRRWRAREEQGKPLVRRATNGACAPAAQATARAAELVRRLQGQLGAEALSRSVPGLSRRKAAWVKAETLSTMERERKSALTRVRITVPGVVRGFDGMYLKAAGDVVVHALFSADAAVPYRTSVTVGPRYDQALVERALSSDIKLNGAPLVYRVDRARCHDAPAVRALLASQKILVLHGPPRCPRFYGQLERQNREHRAWDEEIALLQPEEIEARLERMLEAVNKLWRRRTLAWQSAFEAWSARPDLEIDRLALCEEVSERAARIALQLEHRGKPADLAERLAIEQALESRGYLRREIGGWC
jgi:transposase-like protein